VFVDAHRPWRKVKATDSRTAVDFAVCMRELTDVHDPEAERIRRVLDNLSTHSPGALYQAFQAYDARRILSSLVPLLAEAWSGPTCVEIEIGQLKSACARGNGSTMPPRPASNGCSQLRKPEPESGGPIRRPLRSVTP